MSDAAAEPERVELDLLDRALVRRRGRNVAIAAVVAVAAFLLASGSSGESGHREHAPRPSNAQLPTEVPTVER